MKNTKYKNLFVSIILLPLLLVIFGYSYLSKKGFCYKTGNTPTKQEMQMMVIKDILLANVLSNNGNYLIGLIYKDIKLNDSYYLHEELSFDNIVPVDFIDFSLDLIEDVDKIPINLMEKDFSFIKYAKWGGHSLGVVPKDGFILHENKNIDTPSGGRYYIEFKQYEFRVHGGLKELNPNHHTISNCGNVVDDLNT